MHHSIHRRDTIAFSTQPPILWQCKGNERNPVWSSVQHLLQCLRVWKQRLWSFENTAPDQDNSSADRRLLQSICNLFSIHPVSRSRYPYQIRCKEISSKFLQTKMKIRKESENKFETISHSLRIFSCRQQICLRLAACDLRLTSCRRWQP